MSNLSGAAISNGMGSRSGPSRRQGGTLRGVLLRALLLRLCAPLCRRQPCIVAQTLVAGPLCLFLFSHRQVQQLGVLNAADDLRTLTGDA